MKTTPSTPSTPDRAAENEAVLNDLRNSGIDVTSLHALRESGKNYQDAIPVLVTWLPRVSDLGLHESLLRTLAVPFAKSHALDAVINDFATINTGNPDADTELRWVAGNALEVLWDDKAFVELLGICVDPDYGQSRQMVVLGMGKSKHPDAPGTLIDLLGDADVRLHAVQALRKSRPSAARPALLELRDTGDGYLRKEVDKTLAKLPTE